MARPQMSLMQRQMCMQPVFLTAFTQRHIHERGYNNFNDHPSIIFNEINFALNHSKNTPNLVYVYKKFGEEVMTPEQIMYGFQYIANNRLEKSQDFWNVIVPMVKKQLKTLDHQTARSLHGAIEGAAAMYLQDNEFWDIVEEKLVDDQLHRYLSLEELSEVLVHLGRVDRGSDDMIEIIEKTFIKHRKGLTERTIANAKVGFAAVNKGSEILQRVLEDPNTELPALE